MWIFMTFSELILKTKILCISKQKKEINKGKNEIESRLPCNSKGWKTMWSVHEVSL